MQSLGIVIPVYLNALSLAKLLSKLIETLEENRINYKIILVNDGSPDSSWQIIEKLCKENKNITGIALSKNFGQHIALAAGIQNAKTDWVCTIDADLQDSPEHVIKLLSYAKKNKLDTVYGISEDKKSSFFRTASSKLYFWVNNKLSGWNLNSNLTSLTLFNQKVANEYCKFSDIYRNHLLILHWLGFKAGYYKYQRDQRTLGKSGYSFKKLLQHALSGIYFHSEFFLKYFVSIGLSLTTFSLFYTFWLLIKYLVSNEHIPGWTTLAVLNLFFGGVIISAIGIVGAYIGKTFEQVKHRPLYVIDEIINNK